MVSNKKGNPAVKEGRRVFTVDEVSPAPDRIAVIAVSSAYHPEIIEKLKANGWRYLIYRGWR